MQWQSVWAERKGAPASSRTAAKGGGNGLTLWAADEVFQSKLMHRFPVVNGSGGGLGFLYPVAVELMGPQAAAVPVAAPLRVMVHPADWRLGAAAYSRWFDSVFDPRPVPSWIREQVHINMQGVEGPSPAEAKRGNRSFDNWLVSSVIQSQADMIEPAGWWEASATMYGSARGLDGVYWPPRQDMGGLSGMREAIRVIQDELGRKVCVYVCAAEVADNSSLFNGSAEILRGFAGFGPDGKERPGDTGTVRMCRGRAAWQDQVASFVQRIFRELKPGCVRLDCLKEPAENCFNPLHVHASPLNSVRWSHDLVRKVRAAVDEVDPDALLMTEGQHEAYYAAGVGGALTEIYAGREQLPMRLALPGYWAVPWGPNAGQIEAGMAGYGACQTNALRREFPYVECDADFLPCAKGTPPGTRVGNQSYRRGFPVRPTNYPPNSYGDASLWHALRETFASVLFPGSTAAFGDGVSAPMAEAVPVDSRSKSQWNGRVAADDAGTMSLALGGNWNGSGNAVLGSDGDTQIEITGLPRKLFPVNGTGYYYDANLSTALPQAIATVAVGATTLRMTLPSAFGVVLLPTVRTPALVVARALQPTNSSAGAWPGLPPSMQPRPLRWMLAGGKFVDVLFEAFAPWKTRGGAMLTVEVSAPGLTLNGSASGLELELPALVRFTRPPNATISRAALGMGSRFVRVVGRGVLPLKRWVVVDAASD